MKKRKYTVSAAVVAARRKSGLARLGKGKDWITCKVDRQNKLWAMHAYGSVDAALAAARKGGAR